MKEWKVGLVGLGGSHRAAAYGFHPQIRIGAICDADGDVLESVGRDLGIPDDARFQSYHELLNADIDVVVIGTPVPFHAQQTVDALEAGKHVLCEVTAADSVDNCFRMLDAVRRTGRIFMMAENTVYYHFLRRWRQWAHEGHFGDLFYAECEYVHQIRDLVINRETGKRYWRDNRPPLHYCSHSLGPILEILDDRIVRATGAGASKKIIPEGGVGSIDMQVALFETQKGVVIKLLRSSVASKEPGGHFYSIYGSRGHVENGRGKQTDAGWLYLEGKPGFEDGVGDHAIWR